MEKVLVTGGAGFIGSHLVDALLREKYAVRVVDNFAGGSRDNAAAWGSSVEVLEGDLADSAVAEAACQGVDAVLHHAAIPSVPLSIKDPLKTQRAGEVATLELLQACAVHKIRRVVFAASSSAYGDAGTQASREDQPPAPMSPYAVSKLACEGYMRSFAVARGVDTLSLRYFNIFGPRQDARSPYSAVISIFLERMNRGERPVIYGDGEQTRDFTFVENVVRANLLALKAPQPLLGAVCNIGTGASVSLNDLLREMNEALGTKLDAEYQPARIGDIKHSAADISLAKKLIGYTPTVLFKNGLERLVKS